MSRLIGSTGIHPSNLSFAVQKLWPWQGACAIVFCKNNRRYERLPLHMVSSKLESRSYPIHHLRMIALVCQDLRQNVSFVDVVPDLNCGKDKSRLWERARHTLQLRQQTDQMRITMWNITLSTIQVLKAINSGSGRQIDLGWFGLLKIN